ncbi:MAG: S46 family peptidase, partial [Porphyromonas sp.]|nr:S46 family peptidase [Porphyromonas sp.]
MKRTFLLLAVLFLLTPVAKADKGMWILKELNKENRDRMRQLGFTMPFDKLYNENTPALHNSVVIFGRGCTGITVSNQGLIFTNHHCGYFSIQELSSVDHDYLRDGFVSHALNQELPVPGLTVQYLRSTEDITDRIVKSVAGITDEITRIKAIQAEIAKIEKEVETEPNTTAKVYPFYNNNKYYLISYDVFKDVRMVFAPPSSIGKFGGDTDNWMWPRHTGDFAVFRVYADANNRPAEYNANNKPFTPKAFAKISLSGVAEKDYAMTIGFPGRTNRYLSSWGVENLIKNENTPRIEVRGLKQDVWKSFMEKEQAIRIQYSGKYASSSNYWKNSIGMNKGLRRLNVISEKQKIEKDFARFAESTPERKA